MINNSNEKNIKNESKDNIKNSCFGKLSKYFSTKFTKLEFAVIALLCYGNFCIGSAFSMPSPFFPTEAKSRGVEEKWIGIMIGAGQMAFIPGAVIAGKFVPQMTAKWVLIIGFTTVGVCNLCLGFLQWTTSSDMFLMFGLLLRLIEGLGISSFFTSCYTIIFLNFPEHVPRLYATVEMCFAVGFIFGPAIGGILFQLGEYFGADFCLPFFLMAVLLLFGSIITYKITPKEKINDSQETSFLKVLLNPGVILNLLIFFNAGTLIGWNSATLDLFLDSISELSPSAKGGVFVLSGVTYALFNQLWGSLAENKLNCYIISLFGCFSSLICYIIVGPIPMINIEPNLWLVIVSQVFLGLGLGALFIGSFMQGFRETIDSGVEENSSTYAIVSGIFTSSEAVGTAVGPAIGGYLLGEWGFRKSTVPLVFLQIIIIILIIIFNIFKIIKHKFRHIIV